MFERLTEDGAHTGESWVFFEKLFVNESGNVESTGKTSDCGKTFGKGESKTHGAITAHGKPGRKGVFPSGRNREKGLTECWQFGSQKCPVMEPAIHVLIKTGAGIGHDDEKIGVFDITFKGSTSEPRGVIICPAVEEVKDREFVVRRGIGRRHLRGDDIELDRFTERGGTHGAMKKRHEKECLMVFQGMVLKG